MKVKLEKINGVIFLNNDEYNGASLKAFLRQYYDGRLGYPEWREPLDHFDEAFCWTIEDYKSAFFELNYTGLMNLENVKKEICETIEEINSFINKIESLNNSIEFEI